MICMFLAGLGPGSGSWPISCEFARLGSNRVPYHMIVMQGRGPRTTQAYGMLGRSLGVRTIAPCRINRSANFPLESRLSLQGIGIWSGTQQMSGSPLLSRPGISARHLALYLG